MNYYIIAYAIYLPVTVMLSIWTARRLHQNTGAFLMRKFNNEESIATATNNLIQTGFYLLAFGFSFMYMQIHPTTVFIMGNSKTEYLTNSQQTMESLVSKLGAFTFFVGTLLFLNFIIMLMIQSSHRNHINTEQSETQNN